MISKECASALAAIDAYKPKGRHEQVVYRPVARMIRDFCEQNEEFADAVAQKGGDFGECLKTVVNGAGGSLSDIEAYRRAVSYYFPGAGIRFFMEIDTCAGVNGEKNILPGGDQFGQCAVFQPTENAGTAETENHRTREKLTVDLDDLFD